jgi:hypothetical protein
VEAEMNTETPETNKKMDTFGNRHEMNTTQTRAKSRWLSELKDHFNHAAKLKHVK